MVHRLEEQFDLGSMTVGILGGLVMDKPTADIWDVLGNGVRV